MHCIFSKLVCFMEDISLIAIYLFSFTYNLSFKPWKLGINVIKYLSISWSNAFLATRETSQVSILTLTKMRPFISIAVANSDKHWNGTAVADKLLSSISLYLLNLDKQLTYCYASLCITMSFSNLVAKRFQVHVDQLSKSFFRLYANESINIPLSRLQLVFEKWEMISISVPYK